MAFAFFPGRGLAIAVLGLLSALSCRPESSPDPRTIRGAYALHLKASTEGDYETLFRLLLPEARNQVTEAFENFRECVSIIEKTLPPESQKEALAALGPSELILARGPVEFYEALIGEEKKPIASITQQLGLAIRSVRRNAFGAFEVQTVSGQKSEWVLGTDGVFYRVPDAKESRAIRDAYARSLRILKELRETKAPSKGGRSPEEGKTLRLWGR